MRRARPIPSVRPRVMSLFTGIGGLDLGFQKAGYEIVGACESDPAARAVLAHRFPGLDVRPDVRDLTGFPEGTSVVIGGFPCQDLSQVGRTRGIDGAKSGVVRELFRLLGRQRVDWVVLENVPFMLSLQGGKAIEYLVGRFESLGYRWAYRTIDSRAFGLPQRRLRVFLVASPSGDPSAVLFGGALHDRPAPIPAEPRCYGFYWSEGNRGIGWAVESIPSLKGGSGVGIPTAPAIWFPETGLIGTPDIRDAERLQGLRTDWTRVPPGTGIDRRNHRWRMVGNAVSVPVARWLAGRILSPPVGPDPDTIPGKGKGWTPAARGERGYVVGIDAGPWPRRVLAYPCLSRFLRYDLIPLSEKATSGFRNRLAASRLRIPPGLLDALDKHLASHRR